VNLGDLAVERGDLDAARRAYAEGLVVSRPLGTPPVVVHALEGCAAAATAAGGEGHAARGLRLLGAAAAVRKTSGHGAIVGRQRSRERAQRTAERARQLLGQEEADAAWAEGQAMSLEQAVAYALKDEPGPPAASRRRGAGAAADRAADDALRAKHGLPPARQDDDSPAARTTDGPQYF
jgi:hypothetical protein